MNLPDRIGLVIWLYTPKYVNKLKKYGLLHYVSRKLNYAILYVNQKDAENVEKNLMKLHFVRDIEISQNNKVDFDYEGVLEEVKKMSAPQKEKQEKSSLSLFSEIPEQEDFRYENNSR